MANVKFTELPAVLSADLTDIIAAVQSGVSSQVTMQQVFNLILANMIKSNAGNPNGAVAGSIYQLCWDTVNNVMYVCTTTGSTVTAVWTLAGSVSFPVSMANGGTGKSLVAANGGIVYSDADSLEILAPIGFANRLLMSGINSAPSWSSATYPSTTGANELLFSSSANAVVSLATANSAIFRTNATGTPGWSAPLTNGQLMIGSTGATPVPSTLTAGPNISINNTAGAITISGTGLAGFSWNNVTGTSQAMLVNSGYVTNNAGLVTLTLPATSAFGDVIEVLGKGAGGWRVQCGAGQTIVVGANATTAAGSLSSTLGSDAVYMVCTVANLEWRAAAGPQGNLTTA